VLQTVVTLLQFKKIVQSFWIQYNQGNNVSTDSFSYLKQLARTKTQTNAKATKVELNIIT